MFPETFDFEEICKSFELARWEIALRNFFSFILVRIFVYLNFNCQNLNINSQTFKIYLKPLKFNENLNFK